MRILSVIHQYPPAIGGSETLCALLSEELVRRGHVVEVATTRSKDINSLEPVLPKRECINGVDVYRYRCAQRSRATWHLLAMGNRLRQTWLALAGEALVIAGTGPIAPGIVKHIVANHKRYDLIHVQTLPFAHVACSVIASRMMGIRTAVTPHIHIEHPNDFDLALSRRALESADLLFVDTEAEIGFLQDRGISPKKVVRLGVGIDMSSIRPTSSHEARVRLGIDPGKFVIAFIGRKIANKGLGLVVRTLAEVRRRFPNVMLISAGKPTEFSETLKMTYPDLEGWIDYAEINEKMKWDLLHACDVLVLPSTEEAFGIVFLEAWAASRPVIGARAGGIPWVVDHGVNGLLIDPLDDVGLHDAIVQLVTVPGLGSGLGKRGHDKLMGEYNISSIADRFESALAS